MFATCDCSAACQFDDRFQPATRELMVFTKSKTRYFDLDAVREPPLHGWTSRLTNGETGRLGTKGVNTDRADEGRGNFDTHAAGAPPLDWWLIPYTEPDSTIRQGESMTATFYVGDAITVMNTLPEKSVDLILTSPPFLALRSYLPTDHANKALEIGSEPTPGAFVDRLLDVVEACARVLAPHGSLCFELGDTYSGTDGGGDAALSWRMAINGERGLAGQSPTRSKDGWPLAKSLSLIPETFRWAMVYGHNPHTGRTTPPWRLRNVIRWVRPNPPVGALGDKFRPATSELMVFCKAKDRFFDLDAVREPLQHPQAWAPKGGGVTGPLSDQKRFGEYNGAATSSGAPPLDWWNIPPGGYPGAHYAVWPPELLIKPIKAMCPEKVCRRCGEASRRMVNSTIGQQPQLAAHIRERRVAKGLTPDEINEWFGFNEIAKNWERTDTNGARIPSPEVWPILKERLGLSGDFDEVIQRSSAATYKPHGDSSRQNQEDYAQATMGQNPSAQAMPLGRATKIPGDFGFSDCGHDDYRPGLVLDPFAGSGTTLSVATGHGRDAIGIDLDERNYELSLDRVGPLILQRGEIRDGTGPPD